MLSLDINPAKPLRTTLFGAPEGHDTRILAQIAGQLALRQESCLIHVAQDDAQADALARQLAFFAPEIKLLSFPAWDCLPYDRVSPKSEIVGRRLEALAALSQGWPAGAPGILLTTVSAALQRVVRPEGIAGARLMVTPGGPVTRDGLVEFLAGQAYGRTQTVREAGEFAVRGSILDIFPIGGREAFRIDFFGDDIESIRVFDPVTQRSSGRSQGFALGPVSEAPLDADAIARFRSGYRSAFGAVTKSDPLYESVSAGRRHAGMEHWLPLFVTDMTTLFEIMPGAVISLAPQADQAIAARVQQVREFYEARLTFARKAAASATGKPQSPYQPLDPERLYLDADSVRGLLADRAVIELSRFGRTEVAEEAAATGVDAMGRRITDFAQARQDPDTDLYDAVRERFAEQRGLGRKVLIASYTEGARERLSKLLSDHGMWQIEAVDSFTDMVALPDHHVGAIVLPLAAGFVAPDLAVITEQDILGDRLTRPARRRRRGAEFIAELSALGTGDYVVHVEHGIGRYDGLETLTVAGAPHECLRLLYADNDKLYLPVENLDLLSRYGSEDSKAAVDRLGGTGWQQRRARVRKRLKDMADALIRVAAERAVRKAPVLEPDLEDYERFAARFPFPETDDQLASIDQVLADLTAGRPMDRLVCGDVGFGKTEVALRAAFVAVYAGVQVAVVVPTTLLARQHAQTFSQRFEGLPLRVAHLSRLVGGAEARSVREGLADGRVDIVIGTHALLAKSISFKNLGLLIVDEEQHFGVRQKERLKDLRFDVHVLTLTATPIPRTLQLSLAGVRDLSLMATPPIDRLAVRTFVLPRDPVIIREAILREHFRGGQTYYVCPRISDLDRLLEELKELVPEVRIGLAHGRLSPTEVEDVMSAFYEGRFDVLLCTSIVESGLDIPTANTLILHRADMFGLAQTYQLRGRIGRSKLRGYAYLTWEPERPLSKPAQQRLHVIETLDSLGAGFSLASHDMDIRGAGNLLGEEQSGHVREVGIELYQSMLEEAVSAAKSRLVDANIESVVSEDSWTPSINVGVAVLIPEDYVPDLDVRLELYRRVAGLDDRRALEGFAAELVDRFGPLPPEVENLVSLIDLKQLCRRAGVSRLDAGPKGAMIAFHKDNFARPDKLVQFVSRNSTVLKLRPDHRLIYGRSWPDAASRFAGARKLLGRLVGLVA